MPSEDQLQRAVAQHREAEEAPGLTAEQLEIVNDRVRGEILKRQAIEERLQVSLRFLEIVHSHTDIDSLLASFVSEIKYYTGCEAVGLRVLDTDGSIPYQSYCGFSQEFYELESPFTLKADQCMCINVIKDDCDPGLPFYTSGGSFYSKGTTRLLAKVSEEDKGRTRDVCNREGYESVALIPIRRGDSCWNWTRRSRPLSLAATPKTRSCPSCQILLPRHRRQALPGGGIGQGLAKGPCQKPLTPRHHSTQTKKGGRISPAAGISFRVVVPSAGRGLGQLLPL